MEGKLVFLVCLVAVTSASSIGGHRARRQAPRVDLTRCFEEWRRETNDWINNVGRLTMTLLNVFVSRDAVLNATNDELRRQFDAVFDTSSAQVSDSECKRQLGRTEETLKLAMERRWRQMLEDINRKMQKAKDDAEAALETFSRMLSAFTSQTSSRNNNTRNLFPIGRK